MFSDKQNRKKKMITVTDREAKYVDEGAQTQRIITQSIPHQSAPVGIRVQDTFTGYPPPEPMTAEERAHYLQEQARHSLISTVTNLNEDPRASFEYMLDREAWKVLGLQDFPPPSESMTRTERNEYLNRCYYEKRKIILNPNEERQGRRLPMFSYDAFKEKQATPKVDTAMVLKAREFFSRIMR